MWWKYINEKRNEMKIINEHGLVNRIGDIGAKRINESLMINTSLTKLDLEGDEKIRNEKKEERVKK